MDLSLDQIIANKPKPAMAKKVAPVKAQRNSKPPQQKQGNAKQPFAGKSPRDMGGESIFDRLGSQQHLVFFGNLNKNITANDIAELAGTCGDVERVTMKRNGVVVAFGNKGHAHATVKKLNGVTLDNRMMIVKHGNGEAAIIGTKTVDVKPFNSNKGGFRDDRDSRNGGRGGDRGKPQGGRGGGAARVEKPARTKTPAELDAEMDAYMNSKKVAPKTPAELDAEMDAYMAAKKE